MMPNKEAVPKFVADALGQYEHGDNADVHNDQAVMAKIAVAGGRAEASSSPASSGEEDKKKAAAVMGTTGIADIDEDLIDFEKMQLTFPERLFDLLKGGTVEKAMRWLPGGVAFSVVPKIFYDVVLLNHFQGTKFESFTRKLNRWGFKRLTGKSVPQDCIAYHHPLFREDHPELLKMMRSGRNKFFVPAELSGIASKQAPLQPSGVPLATSEAEQQRLDFAAGACKMGPGGAPSSALQPGGLLGNPAARLGMHPWYTGGAGLSQSVLNEMLRYQAVHSSQQLFPGNLAGLVASSQQQQQQQQQQRLDNNTTLSLRQLLAVQQQQKAASQVNNDSPAGSPFAMSQVSPYLEAQQILAHQRATANEADLRLSQLLAQSAAAPSALSTSGAIAQTRNNNTSLYDTISALGLSQGDAAAAASLGNVNISNSTVTDAQLLRLLLLQEQMERNNNRGGHLS